MATTMSTALPATRPPRTRILAWCALVCCHVFQLASFAIFMLFALNAAPAAFVLPPFAVGFASIGGLLWFYFNIIVRGWRYSPLGPLVPRPIPVAAWHGESFFDWSRIGTLRGSTYWVLSSDGILLTMLFVTVYVPWSEVRTVQSKGWWTWAIDHCAADARSPILCGASVAAAIGRRFPGLISAINM